MVINPLFAPDDEDDKRAQNNAGYVLPNRHGRTLHPVSDDLQGASVHPAHPAAHVLPAAQGAGQTQDSNHSRQQAEAAAHPQAKNIDEPNAAVDLIRRKLENLYAQEPDAKAEEQIIEHLPTMQASTLNSHQQFMHDLSTSGKSLAEIQTAWHSYYANLSDADKHAVWQDFYAANNQRATTYGQFVAAQPQAAKAHEATQLAPAAPHTSVKALPYRAARNTTKRAGIKPIEPVEGGIVVAEHVPSEAPTKIQNKQVAAIKRQIKQRIKLNTQLQIKTKQHLKSLVFGLGTGSLVLLIVLFGLFNEVIITPFIQPSRHAGATPIILDANSVAPSSTPEVIIPKINVEIPVDYTQTTTDEKVIESALNDGTVHYPSTSKPGEKGNTAIFGHSSNNIFNPGKYKFAFVLLHTLVPGDIFYLTYNDKVYSYRVYDKQIVSPSTVSVLDPVAGKTATATLITCDPPGTSLNRLVVWGEQISPDPNTNANATPVATATTPMQIAGNGPTLWQRIISWFH
ncbi:MAG TPA: sortase [Candidatus Saccharimonadales bacterium]|nr:sortase [Candidatus Saccharimonadales bacterium]